VERSRRRLERHLEEACLPPGKTLAAFDFDAVPMISKARVQALAAGDAWLDKGANLLCFGPPGGGKSASGSGARHGPDRKRLARVVHQNHR
jgi:DNA replication protein DnaC